MQDKFTIKVYLAVAAIGEDPAHKDQTQFLVVDEDGETTFPSRYLNRDSITKDIAANLLKEFTGVTLDWAVLLPMGVIDDLNPDKDNISILYGVFIPSPTRIRKENSNWMNYSKLEYDAKISPFIKKLAYEAIWRQV